MTRFKADRILATPAYPLAEAAHYLNLPLGTLRTWRLEQPLTVGEKTRRLEPLIRLDGDQMRALSFLNLVEAHVLAAIRRKHRFSLSVVRQALDYIAQQLRSARPLTEMQFETDGVDLFVGRLGTLINLTREGQADTADALRRQLKRIERNPEGVPVRLFPFARTDERSGRPPAVVIDPYVAFGRPVLAGRSVPTAVLADRVKAGDSFEQLAGDYGASAQTIEEALRCELACQAA